MTKPIPSRAVMERRAPAVIEEEDPQTALYRKLDFFPTPPWAGRAGAARLLELDRTAHTVLEPACGEGHIAEPIRDFFPEVIAADIYDYGKGYPVCDFLLETAEGVVDWVFTNPPFESAHEFIREGLRRARRGVAILGRLALLEGANRFHTLYRADTPLTVMAPFSERVSMRLGRWDPEANFATAYAWFYFCKNAPPGPPVIQPFPPGTKSLFTRANDAKEFGPIVPIAPAPLFDGLTP